jgi:hypothetical protein
MLLITSPLKGVVGTAFLYPAMTACIRISILLFYQRIFGQTEAVVRLTIWAMIVLNCAFLRDHAGFHLHSNIGGLAQPFDSETTL